MNNRSILASHPDEIRKSLRALYPEVKTQLDHRKPFEFLFATVLSAQRTDKQVNKIKSDLFQRLKILQDFVRIAFKDLEDIINATGFFPFGFYRNTGVTTAVTYPINDDERNFDTGVVDLCWLVVIII